MTTPHPNIPSAEQQARTCKARRFALSAGQQARGPGESDPRAPDTWPKEGRAPMESIAQDAAEKTYRVAVRAATVRSEPSNTAPILRRLLRGTTLHGQEVAGSLGGRPLSWVARAQREGGGYIVRALLDEVP